MLSPALGILGRRQAESPLSPLSRFPEPPLRYDERRARNEIVELADISKRLARLPTPLKVAG
jgi:hypothetical protein